jgi:tRNA A-37 threonylcarbamoyl transferase component Bud32
MYRTRKMTTLDTNSPYVYTKQNVTKHEYMAHKMIYNLKKFNVPNIYSYDEEKQTMIMEKIYNMSVSDAYGESAKNVPDEIFDEIRQIIEYLYNMDIIYPDITGYNFIEHENKIWILDFEHVKFGKHHKKEEKFVRKFINGHNGWNPKFK